MYPFLDSKIIQNADFVKIVNIFSAFCMTCYVYFYIYSLHIYLFLQFMHNRNFHVIEFLCKTFSVKLSVQFY